MTEECPICFSEYSECGMKHKEENDKCKHSICLACCYTFGEMLVCDDNYNVLCPLCRENWNEWMYDNFI